MERRLDSILGNSQKLDGGAMFGNAPRVLWERWTPADDQHRIRLVCRALLVREPDRNILFETGIGAFFPPDLRDRYGVQEEEHVLLENLAALGLGDDAIDVVVVSHLHFDHAGGLFAPYQACRPLELMFPNAKFVVGQRAFDRACSPHPRDRASFVPELPGMLRDTGRLELVPDGGGSEILGADYRFFESDGHTPGMLLTEIPMADGPIVFAADLVPGVPWVRRAITMGYDRHAERVIDEKTRLLDDLVERNGRLYFTHDPECAMARLVRDDHGKVTTAEPMAALSDFVA